MVDPAAGTLLIAAPGLLDPNFRRSVVLLCDYAEESCMGLIVNRPMQVPVSQFFPERGEFLASPATPAGLVHSGGPVDTNRMLVLRRGDSEGDHLHEILSEVSLVGNIDDTVSREDPTILQESYRFFLGYSGWGERQLAGELDEDAWIVRPATAELIFETPPAQIWSEALRDLGGEYALFAEMPLDPSLN